MALRAFEFATMALHCLPLQYIHVSQHGTATTMHVLNTLALDPGWLILY